MTELIDFESYPLKETVELLLADKTTKKHIIWATKSYEEKGIEFGRIWIRKSDDVTAHQQDSPDNTDAPKE